MPRNSSYNVDDDALHNPRPRSAENRKYFLPPVVKRDVGVKAGRPESAIWERRKVKRPISGLAVATSPTKPNSIHNLAYKYNVASPIRCGNYEVIKELGRGSFGKVYIAKDRYGKEWALKKIRLHQALTRYDATCIINEIKVASIHNCHYLLKAKDVFVDDRELCLVTELGKRGDLADLIRRRRRLRMHLDEGTIWNYLLQMLIALEYMHKYGIIHRDVKSMNIFLRPGGELILGDFGIAKILPPWNMSGAKLADTIIGTPLYMGPEMVMSHKYGYKVDVWSLGCVLWEMMSLEKAFDARNHALLNKHILSGLCTSSVPEGRYSSDLMKLAKLMIDTDVNRRPQVSEIMNLNCVRRRLEGSGLNIPDLGDLSITSRLQKTVYPPARVGDWTRACQELKNIVGNDKVRPVSKYSRPSSESHAVRPKIQPTRSTYNRKRLVDDIAYSRSRGNISRPVKVPLPTIGSRPPWAIHY